jgi:hypothetical protein
MAANYKADEHMSSFVSSFVGVLASRLGDQATALTPGEKSPFGIIGDWTPEASTV